MATDAPTIPEVLIGVIATMSRFTASSPVNAADAFSASGFSHIGRKQDVDIQFLADQNQ
jgi:hypothetical protein